MFSILNFNKNVLSSAVSAALLVTVSQITLAQESTETVPSVTDTKMEQVLVSATRFEVEGINTAANISVVTAQDIINSGANSIVDVLRSQAGIQLQDLSGDGNNVSVSMRGFGANSANNTLILVDGRKLNNPTLEGPALNSIALKDVERIEIINGSAGVLYGDQAVGGVINVITSKSKTGEMDGWVEAGRGTDDLERYRGRLSYGFDNGVSFRVSGEERREDGYRDNNEASYSNYLMDVRLDKNWGNVFFEHQRIEDDLRLPGALPESDVKVDRRQTVLPNDFSNTDTDILRLGGMFKLSEQIQLLAEFSDRDSDSKGYFYGDLEKDTRVKSFTPRVVGAFSTNHGDAVVTIGYDSVNTYYQGANSLSTTDFEQELEAYYGQLIYPVLEDLSFSLGYRSSQVNDKNIEDSTKNTENAEAVELGLSYQLNESVRLFVRTADGFRFGNADENAYTLSGVDFLKPQSSESVEMGVDFILGDTELSLTLFDLGIENEIYYDNSQYVNVNLDSSNRRGATLEGRFQITRGLSLLANASYVDAELTSGSYDGNEVPYVATYSGNIAGVYEHNSSWTFYLASSYTGSRYRSGDDVNEISRVGAEWVWYANAKYTLDQWTANVRVNNLTDAEIDGFSSYNSFSGKSSYPAAEREVEVSVSYSF